MPIEEIFDLTPGFPIALSVRSRGVRSPIEAGMVQRRRTFQSLGSRASAGIGEVRTWGLEFAAETVLEKIRMEQIRALTSGSARTINFLPPDEQAQTHVPSNSFTSPEDLTDGAAWKLGTTDTGVAEVSVTPPSGISGTTSFHVTNAGGAGSPALIRQAAGVFHRAGKSQRISVFVQRPGGSPASLMTLAFVAPGALPSTGNGVAFIWNGSTWIPASVNGAIGTSTDVGSGWFLNEAIYLSGAITPASVSPKKRNCEIAVGTPAAPSAGLGLYMHGAMLEELVETGELVTYTNVDQRVPVRIAGQDIQITRSTASHYSWRCDLVEAI